jgi:hypothetical protein
MDIPHNPRSTVNIAGHPIHPMLIPFPSAPRGVADVPMGQR